MNSVREAVEKIRKVASNWLTDQTTDGATAMGEITAALLNTSFEEPQFITIDPSLTGRQLEDLRARLEDAKGQTLMACDALIDIHASEWRTDASRDVLMERRRQVEVEGRTPEHDDKYAQGDLAEAAGTYALHAYDAATLDGTPAWWPWEAKWFKLSTPRRNLVKAGALILAEIERLDRAELSKGLAEAAMLRAAGWIVWNADACGPRPENVAKVRFQNGDETASVSGVNWAPQSDSFRHCQVVAYLPKAADDGWIEWTGGLCPVADLDAMIWVRLEGDAPTTFGRPGYASRWDWRHEPEMGRTRVVAYRLTDPAVHP